jgi:hypothetical protein
VAGTDVSDVGIVEQASVASNNGIIHLIVRR